MDFIYRGQGPAEIAVTTVQSLLVIVNITGNSFVCLIIVKNKDMSSAVARPNGQPRQGGVARGVREHAPPPRNFEL